MEISCAIRMYAEATVKSCETDTQTSGKTQPKKRRNKEGKQALYRLFYRSHPNPGRFGLTALPSGGPWGRASACVTHTGAHLFSLLSINNHPSPSELELLIASHPLLGPEMRKSSILNVLAQGRRNEAFSSSDFYVNYKDHFYQMKHVCTTEVFSPFSSSLRSAKSLQLQVPVLKTEMQRIFYFLKLPTIQGYL